MNRDKRGTDKMLSMYWFLILTIVAGGVFAMVYVFYGAPYDVRQIESEIFADKIADCISKQGIIDSEFFIEGKFNENISKNFNDKCNINFNVEDDYTEKEIQYLYIVDFYDVKNLINLESANLFKPEFYFYVGNLNFYIGNINEPEYTGSVCEFTKEGEKEYIRFIECTERRFYAVNEEGNQYLIKVIAGIGKSEKNVKQ